MNDEKKYAIDPRVYLFLVVASAISGLTIHSELAMNGIFVMTLIFVGLSGDPEKIPGYVLGYGILWGITKICIMILSTTASGIALSLSNIGISGRRAMSPFLFTLMLAKVPVGSLMAALNAMGLPKVFSIGIATIMRFFPTLKQEYRCIRNAQKFRGLGVGFWGTLLHLPEVFVFVLIPVIIRITRISEELSASITVRGVSFGGDIVSYRPVSFTARDRALLLTGLLFIAMIILIDSGVWKGIV